MRHTLIAAATVIMLTGCGTSSVVTSGKPVADPYTGPMKLKQDFADRASVLEQAGAAGRALECDTAPYRGGGGHYDIGLESAQESATAALEDLLEEELGGVVPDEGYRIEREDDGRVLFSYDVDERTKIAFIAAAGIHDFNGDTGWGVESWAQCDPAELPSSTAEALGVEVWEDASGHRVPTTEIQSFPGANHCDWQDITFLQVGPEHNADEYVRDVQGELNASLRTTYAADATLPTNATDTGYHRDGRELWLVPGHQAAYLVSLQDPQNVERWPAAKQPIGCA